MKELEQISSETCLQHLWRITSNPPDYVQEVSVVTSASMHERTMALVLRGNCMAVEELEQQLDIELVQVINKETTKQANSKPWIDLHKVFYQEKDSDSEDSSFSNVSDMLSSQACRQENFWCQLVANQGSQ